MREIVQVQIGQCGNRVGTHFWEVISDEHGIDLTGSAQGASANQLYGSSVYFNEKSSRKYEPRAVLIDLEPSALDSIRAGASGRLFNPDMYVFGLTGSGNTWAQGFYGEGRDLADTVLDAIRRETEGCDCLQGFQICHSIGGGTGSGLGSLLCGLILEAYSDRILETFTVFPSRQVSDSVLEPYNATLAIPPLVENVGLVMTLDNEALYEICAKNLNLASPTYGELNHQISAVMGGVTCAMRFPSTPNTDLRKIVVNLVPYPRLHFFALSHAPMSSRNGPRIALTVPEIAEAVFDPRNLMRETEQAPAKYMVHHHSIYTMAAIYRGNVSSYEIEMQLFEQRRDNPNAYQEWISNSIFNCICATPSKDFPVSATLIANSNSTQIILKRMSEQFTAMFRKKAFLHWYTREGMDEMEFTEAESNMNDLVSEFQGCDCCACEEDEEEEQVEDE